MDEQKVPQYWAVLPSAVRYDTRLPASAKLLYAEISSLTQSTGYCYASNDYFERLYGVSERTLQRWMDALDKAGYIRIEDGDGGKNRRRIYAGINPLLNPDKNDGVTPTKMTGLPRQKCRGEQDNKQDNLNIPPEAPTGGRRVRLSCEYEPELFERFWKAYPRGDDKAGARREWDRLKPSRKLMRDMSAALARQKETDEWRRGIGIPYACRWLRNRRWEDEVRELPRADDRGGRADVGIGPCEEAVEWV